MDDTVTDDRAGGVPDGPAETPHTRLQAEIVVSATQPAELIAFPVDATGLERATRWIVATEGSFVGLEDVR